METGRARVSSGDTLEESTLRVECLIDHLVPVLGAVSVQALRLKPGAMVGNQRKLLHLRMYTSFNLLSYREIAFYSSDTEASIV